MQSSISFHPDIWKLHDAAIADGETFYEDPDSGFLVFTSAGLEARGKCCGSGCRHCPYAHENVPEDRRGDLIQQASWLNPLTNPTVPADLLFWSGGKDSFLTLREIQRSASNQTVLVTTFDAHPRKVAHQELDLDLIIRQAQHLNLPLLGIPLHPGRDYEDAVRPALSLVPNPARLVFGDLHLEHIRGWREQAFEEIAKNLATPLAFPLWHTDYESLIDDLEASSIVCEVSAVTPDAKNAVQIGDHFNRALMESLPEGVDRFGENGEFHTLARVWDTA
ncbi:MAG: hypothetical protein HRU46_04760 [Verrucomicrobiales bacterium]|nr:hypothetical protein [Verrucomicrobiales bacterium]